MLERDRKSTRKQQEMKKKTQKSYLNFEDEESKEKVAEIEKPSNSNSSPIKLSKQGRN